MRLFLILSLLASPVYGDCLTPNELQTGIVVEYIDNTFETLTPHDSGLVASHWQGQGQEARTLLVHGMYFVKEQTIGTAPSPVEFFPDGGYAALPRPVPGLTTVVEMLLVQNGVEYDQSWEVIVGQPGETVYGDCTYASLDVVLNIYEAGSLSYKEDYLYFPDLGFGALLGYDGPGNDDYRNTLSGLRSVDR